MIRDGLVKIEELQRYLQDRNIHLCGNGTSKHPDLKDTIKIRINKGIKLGKCDVWVNNLLNHKYMEKYHKRAKYVLRLNGENEGERLFVSTDMCPREKLYVWTAKGFQEASKEVHGTKSARPLSGTLAIYWLLNECKVSGGIFLTGFDFFQYGKPAAGVHYPLEDKRWVEKQPTVYHYTQGMSYEQGCM